MCVAMRPGKPLTTCPVAQPGSPWRRVKRKRTTTTTTATSTTTTTTATTMTASHYHSLALSIPPPPPPPQRRLLLLLLYATTNTSPAAGASLLPRFNSMITIIATFAIGDAVAVVLYVIAFVMSGRSKTAMKMRTPRMNVDGWWL